MRTSESETEDVESHFDSNSLRLTTSFSSNNKAGMESKKIIKQISKYNIKLLENGQAQLSKECLIRVRMYQLVKGLKRLSNGKLGFVFSPEIEGRVTFINTASKQ